MKQAPSQSLATFSSAFLKKVALTQKDPDYYYTTFLEAIDSSIAQAISDQRVLNPTLAPTTLMDLVYKATEMDSSRRRQRPDITQRITPRQYTPAPSLPDTSSAMDIDATRIQSRLPRLTDAERAILRQKGACFKCRQEGHMANDCPTRYPRTRETQTCFPNAPGSQPQALPNAPKSPLPTSNPMTRKMSSTCRSTYIPIHLMLLTLKKTQFRLFVTSVMFRGGQTLV